MKKLALMLLWFPMTSLLLVFSLFMLAQSPKQTFSTNLNLQVEAADSRKPSSPVVNVSPASDFRVTVLQNFFAAYKSPLAKYADILVSQADRWGIDYTLIPAISMQESNGCLRVPLDSYNCWGFGIYGSKVTRFSSYDEAISTIARAIKETYIKRGLTNPTLLEDIWAPPSRGQWSYAVNFFISKIKEQERNLPPT